MSFMVGVNEGVNTVISKWHQMGVILTLVLRENTNGPGHAYETRIEVKHAKI